MISEIENQRSEYEKQPKRNKRRRLNERRETDKVKKR